MTSVTLKTFPDMPVASISVLAGAKPNSEAFWDLVTLIFSSAPTLQDLGVTGYTFIAPETPYNGTTVGGFLGTFQLPNATVAELQEAIEPLQKAIAAIPGVTASYIPTQYPSLYSWYQVNKNRGAVGGNNAVGNRLLDAKALSNVTALRAAMQKATPPGTIATQNLVSGPGVRDAVPAGGSDSVLPAWRDAYIEYGGLDDAHRHLVYKLGPLLLTRHSRARQLALPKRHRKEDPNEPAHKRLHGSAP